MTAVGMFGPPAGRNHSHENREEAAAIMEILLARTPDELAVPVSEFVHIVRLLTFSGSHPHLSDGRILTPDEIVTTVLDGLPHRTQGNPDASSPVRSRLAPYKGPIAIIVCCSSSARSRCSTSRASTPRSSTAASSPATPTSSSSAAR